MSDTDDLLGAVLGQHRVTLIVENGEFGCRCICGWTHHSTPNDTNVSDLIDQIVLAALVHTTPRPDTA